MEFTFQEIQWHQIFDYKLAWDNLPFIIKGLSMTLYISVIGMLLGLIFGLMLDLMRNSRKRILLLPSRMFMSFMRGIPVLVFLFILYFGLVMIGIKMTASVAACLGFGLNSAAYIAEINRAAFNSIDVGQWESAKALNMNATATLFSII